MSFFVVLSFISLSLGVLSVGLDVTLSFFVSISLSERGYGVSKSFLSKFF